ncbi:MAG: aspartyl/asparaginyl beta-hydroxylase domain-containing protein [Candidatus Binatia bacterium]|nr:aspartyl/asparaginyl beta-hydroxylase domain-containing protein [Candidatus Binatia bacterium]
MSALRPVDTAVPASSFGENEPLYFRIYGNYAGAGPRFYDPATLPWTAILRRECPAIRAELQAYLEHGGRFAEHFIPDRVDIRGWGGIKLVTQRRPYRQALRAFPHTASVLATIPDLVSASFSVLEPGARLPQHCGDTNLFYRAHLGLVVPGPAELCGIEVDGERRGWEEGGVVVFNDARRHYVWNLSDRPRIILMCDVMKPEYGGGNLRNCSLVLGAIALLYLQFRVPFLQRLPRPAIRAMHEAASLPFRAYLAACAWPPGLAPDRRHGATLE